MKQHITNDQLAELSDSQKVSLRRWVLARFPKSRGGTMTWINVKPPLPHLSIGQMIEYMIEYRINKYGSATHYLGGLSGDEDRLTLCNDLWEDVKIALVEQPITNH